MQGNHLAPVVATGPAKKQLSIATYNVENLAPGNPDSKFAALAQGIVTNLASPDIIAAEEVQDNDGATDDGVVAADQTISKLTAAVVAAGGPQYDAREIDPVNDQDGGQPGGNIRVVFLYNPATVTFVDAGDPTVNRSTTGTAVVKKKGEPALTLSPGRIDPGNSVWDASRKPLAGQFRFNGKDVFVIANHFDSKLGDQNADGRFQFPAQSSAVQRAGQAQTEHQFVSQILNVDKNADVVAGLGADPAELAAAASRQALAESGWEAVGVRPLLTLRQNGGLTDSAVHIFVTREAIHRGPPEADFEAGRIEWVPLADAPGLIAQGEVRDASTAAALLWLNTGQDAGRRSTGRPG